ncbi:hypothetical protein CQ12_40060 [Bradyrhizobium jicamae]|uniref:Uncharacterized protein n=1 Tax=Bradyrhizobium jicamae TaxID=280332 RepID=A0A0R3KPT4_9BRAD|nr:hypothetical protein CQ12_40060 [Bradyrhizobium jicamae]
MRTTALGIEACEAFARIGDLPFDLFGVSNIFINVAIIALVASPIVINRFFLEAGLSKRAMQVIVGGYATCSVATPLLSKTDRFTSASLKT